MPSLLDDEVTRRILPHVTQCPTALLKTALIDTLYDFLDETEAYQVELDPIATVIDQALYDLVLPAGYQFSQVQSARLNGIPLEEKSADALDIEWPEISRAWSFSLRHDLSFGGLDDPTWRTATSDQPRFYHFETNAQLRLIGIASQVFTGTAGIIVKVSLKPIVSAVTAIDDALWNDNYQFLVAGTIAALKMLKDKPWSDPRGAIAFQSKYESGRNEQTSRVKRSLIRNDRNTYRSRCYS